MGSLEPFKFKGNGSAGAIARFQALDSGFTSEGVGGIGLKFVWINYDDDKMLFPGTNVPNIDNDACDMNTDWITALVLVLSVPLNNINHF